MQTAGGWMDSSGSEACHGVDQFFEAPVVKVPVVADGSKNATINSKTRFHIYTLLEL